MVDRNWRFIRSTARGELSLRLWHGTALDLHWHVLNTQEMRATFRFPTAELLASAEPLDLGETVVPVLSLDETIVYVALHACLAGGHLLGWTVDVARLMSRGSDWRAVSALAERRGAGPALEVMANRARRLLWGTHAAGSLPPPASPGECWAVALRKLNGLRGDRTWSARRRTLATVVSSTRADHLPVLLRACPSDGA